MGADFCKHKYAAITRGTKVVERRCIFCNHKRHEREKINQAKQKQNEVAKNNVSKKKPKW